MGKLFVFSIANSFTKPARRHGNSPGSTSNRWSTRYAPHWQAPTRRLAGIARFLLYQRALRHNNANPLLMRPHTVTDAGLTRNYDKKTNLRLISHNLIDRIRVHATGPYNTQFDLGKLRRFDLIAEMKF